MSERAKEAALREYPPSYSEVNRNAKRIQSYKVDTHKPIRQIYIKGYEQAEKDLALTADDMELIDQIFTELCGTTDAEGDEYYEKVLRMFNEQRP